MNPTPVLYPINISLGFMYVKFISPRAISLSHICCSLNRFQRVQLLSLVYMIYGWFCVILSIWFLLFYLDWFLMLFFYVRCGLNMQEICVHSDVNVYVYDCISSVNINTYMHICVCTHTQTVTSVHKHTFKPKGTIGISNHFSFFFIYLLCIFIN